MLVETMFTNENNSNMH